MPFGGGSGGGWGAGGFDETRREKEGRVLRMFRAVTGLIHRSRAVKSVGTAGQQNRWLTV